MGQWVLGRDTDCVSSLSSGSSWVASSVSPRAQRPPDLRGRDASPRRIGALRAGSWPTGRRTAASPSSGSRSPASSPHSSRTARRTPCSTSSGRASSCTPRTHPRRRPPRPVRAARPRRRLSRRCRAVPAGDRPGRADRAGPLLPRDRPQPGRIVSGFGQRELRACRCGQRAVGRAPSQAAATAVRGASQRSRNRLRRRASEPARRTWPQHGSTGAAPRRPSRNRPPTRNSEAAPRVVPLLEAPVVLFDPVIFVATGAVADADAQRRADGARVGVVPVHRDLRGGAPGAVVRLGEEALRRVHVAPLAE